MQWMKRLLLFGFSCVVVCQSVPQSQEIKVPSSEYRGTFAEAMKKATLEERAFLTKHCSSFEVIMKGMTPHLSNLNYLLMTRLYGDQKGIENAILTHEKSVEAIFIAMRSGLIQPLRVSVNKRGGNRSVYFETYSSAKGNVDILKLMFGNPPDISAKDSCLKDDYEVGWASSAVLRKKYANYEKRNSKHDELYFKCNRTINGEMYSVACTWAKPPMQFKSEKAAKSYALAFHNWLFIFDFNKKKTLVIATP
jgi:hypothetical protein